jgi:hypothetical protein
MDHLPPDARTDAMLFHAHSRTLRVLLYIPQGVLTTGSWQQIPEALFKQHGCTAV